MAEPFAMFAAGLAAIVTITATLVLLVKLDDARVRAREQMPTAITIKASGLSRSELRVISRNAASNGEKLQRQLRRVGGLTIL